MKRMTSMVWLVLVLMPGLVLCGCGDDDSPTEPEPEDPILETAFFEGLFPSMKEAAGLVLVGGGRIEGMEGALVVTPVMTTESVGATLAFEGFSHDGEIYINGELSIDLMEAPATVTGDLTLSGTPTGTAVVSATYDLATEAYGGTITIEGEEYDVAAIASEVLAEDGD